MADKKAPKAAEAEPVKVPEKAPKVVEVNPNEGKNIDERMADLLADHKRMGAR